MKTIPRNPSSVSLNSKPEDFARIIDERGSLIVKMLELIDQECDGFNPISVLGALECLYAQAVLDNGIPLEIALGSVKEVYKRIRNNRREV